MSKQEFKWLWFAHEHSKNYTVELKFKPKLLPLNPILVIQNKLQETDSSILVLCLHQMLVIFKILDPIKILILFLLTSDFSIEMTRI